MKKNIAHILAVLILLGIAVAKGNTPTALAAGLKNNQTMDYVVLLNKTIKTAGADNDPQVIKVVLKEIELVLDLEIAALSALDFPSAGKYPAGIDPASVPAGPERDAYVKALEKNDQRNRQIWFHQALLRMRDWLLREK